MKNDLERLAEIWPKGIVSITIETNGCWIWNGYLTYQGYGAVMVDGKTHRAHRYYWSLLRGPIEKELVIDHLCRNKRCVNPEHLEPVTVQVNTLRGDGPTAKNAQKTHCKNGHPLAGDNLYLRGGKQNERACRLCRKTAALDSQKRARRNSHILKDAESRAEAAESRVLVLEEYLAKSHAHNGDLRAVADGHKNRADKAEALCAGYRGVLGFLAANYLPGVSISRAAKEALKKADSAAEKLLARLRAAEELYNAAHDLSRAAKDIEDEENQRYRLNKACAAYADACDESKPPSPETPPPPRSQP